MKKTRVYQVVGSGFIKDLFFAGIVGTAVAFIVAIILKLMTGYDVETLFSFMPRKHLFYLTAFSYVTGAVFYMRSKRRRW
ncbi:MAG: hypothetical protein PHQ52_06055 [Candidatus Omnitrophica bacterium]|nr:hypothetical protein [Candidatus Omnitrophota bacterium]